MRSSVARYLLMLSLCLVPIVGASPACGKSRPAPRGQTPQCGHWVVLRCCEILGVPLDMEDVVGLLPFRQEGHSMSSLQKTLETIGLRVEAREARFSALVKGRFPVIAHLQPDHYVAVVRADERYVTLFDGYGRRVRRAAAEFRKQWSGKILRVSRPSGATPLPAFLGSDRPRAPRMQFDFLLLDKGEILDTGQPAEFVFPFRNAGHGDLMVEQIKTTCACVTSEKPEQPIPAGQEGVITLKYTLERTLGSFHQSAYVRTNDPVFPVVRLTASGNTQRAVSVSPQSLNLGKVIAGTPSSICCAVQHSGDDPLQIRAVETEGPGMQVKYRLIDEYLRQQNLVRARSNSSRLEFLFAFDDRILGERNASVRVKTNIEGYEQITLPVTAEVVLPIELHPSVLVFSKTEGQQIGAKGITAVSRTGELFRIVSVDTQGTPVTCSFPPAPAREVDLSLAVKPGSRGVFAPDSAAHIVFELLRSGERWTAKVPLYSSP